MKSRRSILSALGTLPALTFAGSVERSCADTTLLALGTRFEELAAKFDADIEGRGDLSEDMIREFGHIELEILATEALTVEGFASGSAGALMHPVGLGANANQMISSNDQKQ